mmetsp:Transcript_16388/g.40469  ORF Transcript_16388/g.40469 Transcript_16388/m.40469 type:complete len:309 (-) Transcript_16388:308-1234(-)
MGGCASQPNAASRRNQANQQSASAAAAAAGSSAQATGGNDAGAVGAASSANSGGPESPGAASAGRGSRQQRDRSVRQAPIVKALVAVENEHIKLERSGAGTYDLSLEMSATGRGFEVTAIFNGNVSEPQEHNVIPSISAPDPSCEFKKTVSGQNKVTFVGIPKSMLSVMQSPKESELPNEMPLVIHIRSLQENYSSKNVNALWFYCNLKENENEKYEVLVMKKLVACEGRSYLLQNLFGGTVTVPGTEGDGQECVVCLSAPREVVVLHCKHVCLCKACANVTSSTWSYQCPICRGRVAAFVGVADGGG